MTDNDYIAEYVKEKHSNLLGLDFVMWVYERKLKETGRAIIESFNNPDFQKALKEAINKKQMQE